MEERKNHPSSSSLPSNYVTLAQLQERWLKQQNQPQPQHQEPPEQNHKEQQPHKEEVIVPRTGNASRSQPPQKQYVVKKNRNRNDSETSRRATTELVASDDHRKSEAVAGTGDETVSKSKKNYKWKNRKVNRKPKTEERGEASGTAAQGKKEAEKKATIENELKDKKNGDSVTVEEVEQSVRVLSINSGNAKENGRSGKMNKGVGHSQSQNGEAQGNELKEKKKKNGGSVTVEQLEQSVRVLSINSGNGKQNGRLGKMNKGVGHSQSQNGEAQGNEWKEKKKNGGSVTVEQVEQSVRVLSINSGDGKQNGGLGKMNNGFRHSQSQRKHYGGYGNRNGQQQSKAGLQRTEKKMVWVKKDEIVG